MACCLSRNEEDDHKILPPATVHTGAVRYPLERANEALADLCGGRLTGAAVLVP